MVVLIMQKLKNNIGKLSDQIIEELLRFLYNKKSSRR